MFRTAIRFMHIMHDYIHGMFTVNNLTIINKFSYTFFFNIKWRHCLVFSRLRKILLKYFKNCRNLYALRSFIIIIVTWQNSQVSKESAQTRFACVLFPLTVFFCKNKIWLNQWQSFLITSLARNCNNQYCRNLAPIS